MSNCNPHLFGGDHHCGSCGRSAEDIVTELEAENAKLRAELAEKYSTESHAIAATLGKENLRLQAERDALKGKIARLEAELAELKKQ